MGRGVFLLLQALFALLATSALCLREPPVPAMDYYIMVGNKADRLTEDAARTVLCPRLKDAMFGVFSVMGGVNVFVNPGGCRVNSYKGIVYTKALFGVDRSSDLDKLRRSKVFTKEGINALTIAADLDCDSSIEFTDGTKAYKYKAVCYPECCDCKCNCTR